MAKHSAPKPLQTIDLCALHDVTGGRISYSKSADPQVVQSMKTLAETVQAVGTAMSQAKAQKQQQTMSMMQQMMSPTQR